MATEELGRRSPLGPLADELSQSCSSELFSCREDAFRTLTDLRCADAGRGALEEAVGGSLPAVGRTTLHDGVLVLGLGPGWWMTDAPADTSPVSGPQLGSAPVAAVDVSAQRTPLVLGGSAARSVLGHGMSFDVHPDHFAFGACAQTTLAKAGVILARTAPDEYRVWVRASFARYLASWLLDASVEYRPETVST